MHSNKHRRRFRLILASDLPPIPAALMDLHELLAELKNYQFNREDLRRLMQQGKLPQPARRGLMIDKKFVPRPLWRRADVNQALFDLVNARIIQAQHAPPPRQTMEQSG